MPADAQAAVALPAPLPESEPVSPAPAEIAVPDVAPPAAPPAATAAAPPRRPARAGDGGIERMLQGLMERPSPAVRGPRPVAAPPPATPESPAAAAEPASPAATAGQAAEAPAAALPAAGAAPAGETGLPAAPPEDDFYELPPLLEAGAGAGDALPGEEPPVIFNPLEIGAMVESEEIDWDDEDDTQGGPGAVWMPPRPSQPASGAEPAAGAPAEPAAAVQPNPTLDDTGMSWLDEADSGKDDNAARAASLFDEEEDFFDLAGELEQELSQEAAFQESDLLSQQEQSLEEIVEGFKKGVAEHLSPTDYDTHYNLGIAYREMGLLDEAIGEFQLSAKDPRYLVSCCSMLGLCFLDKGLPELAIKWYRRGLEAEQIAEDDTLGLLYDMGCAYLAMGDTAGAYKTFVDVYGINTNYRDVVARIEELGHPH
jgi:tetratricopeptide (TPR) repeat protein